MSTFAIKTFLQVFSPSQLCFAALISARTL